MVFEIIAKDSKSKARVGKLTTKSGVAETPFFMPVATKTTVKYISIEDLETMGAQAIICNAFVLSFRPGVSLVKNAGGISGLSTFKGIIFTDSGGFQMYSPQLYVRSKEDGVIFRNPFSGEQVFITPEIDMDIQLGLGSDVAMCLDSMPLIEESKESIAEAVRKTGLWAQRCKLHHDNRQIENGEKRQLLFGICQGGVHTDLREQSAREIAQIDFDGYAIGGLALGEPKKDEYKMIETAKNVFPENKPIYLMGAGEPLEMLEAISRGVDIFDSRFPTKNARRGNLFTSKGRIRLFRAEYAEDKTPIDTECSCFVCKRYSKSYIRHLLRQEEGTGKRLASYHNLYFLQNLMHKAREAIKQGKFTELLDNYRKINTENLK